MFIIIELCRYYF